MLEVRPQMKERRSLRVGWVAAMLLVVVAVGCLLGAQPLADSAERIGSPTLRSAALVVARPLTEVSERLYIDEARRRVLAVFSSGGGQMVAEGAEMETTSATGPDSATEQAPTSDRGSAPDSPTSTPPTSTPPTSPPTSTPPTSSPDSSPTTTPSSTTSSPDSSPTTTPSSTTSTTAAKPSITADRPLRVLVAGDSLVLQVGHGVARLSEHLPLEAKVMSKPISGLSRPDFYDWPAVLGKAVAEFQPDVTVLMYGNNDKQDVVVGGKRLARFSPDWWGMYRGRVESFLQIPTGAGSRVIWVGMPIMRSAKFSESARSFNSVYAELCAAAGVSYLDAYRLFSSEDGRYSAYLPDQSGKQVLMRGSDGIHLTEAGGDLVAAAIAQLLREFYNFE